MTARSYWLEHERSLHPHRSAPRVAAQACHRWGYCLTSEAIIGTPLEIDHIIPQSLGGPGGQTPYPATYSGRWTSPGSLFSHHEGGSDATITMCWR
jgi:hypothetical protein